MSSADARTRTAAGLTRRRFGALLAGTGSALAAPAILGAARPKVVVVGGGAGGATAARRLGREGRGRLDVTLVEPRARYVSCFGSNLHLGGYRGLAELTHDYAALGAHGVRHARARAEGIDLDSRHVRLAGGGSLAWDRLVLSPGIDLVPGSVPGWSEAADAERAPHAWRGGEQLALLGRRVAALEDGDEVLVIAPPNPYRCPPGPYERVSMIARSLKRRGLSRCRITILDAKPSFAKQALFDEAWRRHYPGTIDWLPPDVHGGVLAVDAAAGTVETELGAFRGALLNVIPAQRAGRIAREAGLADASGFCPIESPTLRSTEAADVTVLGDAADAGPMPKSAFAANSQARLAAARLRHELLDDPVPEPRLGNVCWSLVADDDSIKVGASYLATAEGIATTAELLSGLDEPAARRRDNVVEWNGWYRSITRDMFGRAAG